LLDKKVVENISSSVDSLRNELIKLVSELVQIPSISPKYPGVIKEEVLGGESEVTALLQPIMESLGLKTDRWEIEPGRANLVGVYPNKGDGKSLIFNGHVDVVPPGNEDLWNGADPWSGKVADGRIYGRGACDMKSGIAASIMAIKALLTAGIQLGGEVILQNVVGEETMDTESGTGAAIKRGYRADAGIVMEPSAPPFRLALLRASPGVLTMRVGLKGKSAHTCVWDEVVRAGGAGSKVAVSAIDKALIIYSGLRELEREWGQTKSHSAFTRPGHFTLCPTTLVGGLDGISYIPDECYIDYAIWHSPNDRIQDVKGEIQDQINRFAQTDSWLRENPPTIEYTLWWPPYDVPEEAPICQAVDIAVTAATGEPAKKYGFAAVNDAAFLNREGIPTITLGPGDLANAHAYNEYVEIEDVIDAAKIYACTMAEWCGFS
jgi:acetylornithine deacetylase/succinyl-diaminopimelate desuccinylase family protein